MISIQAFCVNMPCRLLKIPEVWVDFDGSTLIVYMQSKRRTTIEARGGSRTLTIPNLILIGILMCPRPTPTDGLHISCRRVYLPSSLCGRFITDTNLLV